MRSVGTSASSLTLREAHVGLDLAHLLQLDLGLDLELRLGGAQELGAQHRVVAERDHGYRARGLRLLDEVEHDPVGEVEGLDQHRLARAEAAGVVHDQPGQLAGAHVAHGASRGVNGGARG
jgi:hypothetical protein